MVGLADVAQIARAREMESMKSLRLLAVVSVIGGVLAYPSRTQPIYAAANGMQAGATASHGAEVYANNCAMCHGKNREGNPPVFPSLVGVGSRLTADQISTIVQNGRGKMPPASGVKGADVAAVVAFVSTGDAPPAAPAPAMAVAPATGQGTSLADAGAKVYAQNCSFCHGRDTMGGESGPDLTRSKLVHDDVNGDKISDVVRQGRNGDKKMPAFNLSADEMNGLVAFIHRTAIAASKQTGSRKGVDVADLQTGDLEAGKRYFNGAGTCSTCHSPTGDLAGVASRYQGLALEERMLYPRRVESKVAVTLPNGQTIAGTLAYHDEFVIGMRDGSGVYHSWRVGDVKYKIDAPVNAHADLLPKYSDADIHNLMAYIQTLR